MNDGIVVTALDARANFGKLLRRVEDEGRSLEPEVLRILGQESRQKGTSRLGAREIDQIIKTARKSRR